MTLPVWPTTVPSDVDRDNFSLDQPYAPAAVTQFEDGPDRMRRRNYTRIKVFPYRLVFLNDTQVQALRTFFDDTLGDGTSHFTMPVTIPGGGLQTRRVYLQGGQYKVMPMGLQWAVTFTLCVFPAT